MKTARLVPAAAFARRRGLTLLELMIGLVILAILSVIAAPPFASWLSRNRVKAAAVHLVADLGEARHEATRRGQVLHVAFQTGSNWCYAITLDAAQGCDSTSPAVLKRVNVKDHPGVAISAAQPMVFDGRSGTAIAGVDLQAMPSTRFVSTRGDALQVQMSALGRAHVCAPEGAVMGLPACASR